ncbi:MAG: hypothetical protein WD050_02155 [Actinomycetota bacterium]
MPRRRAPENQPLPARYDDNVFINCPFDEKYRRFFRAVTFTIHDAGFVARCALEISHGTQNRLDRIMGIVSEWFLITRWP